MREIKSDTNVLAQECCEGKLLITDELFLYPGKKINGFEKNCGTTFMKPVDIVSTNLDCRFPGEISLF